MDLNELTFDNVGDWPLGVKLVFTVLVCVALLVAGYFFAVRPQLTRLTQLKQDEVSLRSDFEFKAQQAASLEQYKMQIEKIKKIFKVMLGQLPTRTEIPNLIEDISKMGVANGLQFTLIKPQAEEEKDFYVELPIKISVLGNYHQFSEFISALAGLPRIVTMNDFVVSRIEEKGQNKQEKENKRASSLRMDMTAKTYRYNDNESEI